MFLSFLKYKFLSSSKILFISLFILLPINFLFSQKGGYVDKLSVAQGDSITFYISSALPKIQISFFKLENKPIWKADSNSVNAIVQSVPDSAYWYGTQWVPTLKYKIPLTWQPGVYRAEFKITANPDTAAAIIFIVKNKTPGTFSKTLFILSTNTWNAYNSYGGKSLYSFNSTNSKRSFKVSFQRPFERDLGIFGAPDFYRFAGKLINWAANNNILFETASMYDLDSNPTLLSNYNVVFIAGHNEYWSRDERRQMENFIRGGGKLIDLSGNTSWWQVRFEDNGNTMVCYKDKNADKAENPSIPDSLVTVHWWDTPVNNPANILFGADFREGGYVNSPPFLLKSLGYGDYAAFNTHYWVFNGTGLKEGDEFGFERELVGYETDGALFDWNNGMPIVLDTLNEPTNYRIFGVSPTQRSDTTKISFGHATMGYFTNQNGGAVFNGATTNWVNALYTDTTNNNNIVPDTSVDRITKNVYYKFKENRLPPEIVSWTPFMIDSVRINNDPEVVNSRDTLVSPGNSQLLTVNAVDPKNQTMNYKWELDGTTIDNNNSTYTFVNPEIVGQPQHKSYTAKVYVYNLVDTSTISWNLYDYPLVINPIPQLQVNQGDNFIYQVNTFNFNRDTLTFSLINNSPSWLTINTKTGLITGTAPSSNNFGQVTVLVTDKHNNSDEAFFNVVTGIEFENTIPNDYKLLQNYPNPFNPETIISFQIPVISNVTLKIYDVLGREVTTLVNKEMKAGSYKVDFNSRGLASGIYFYRLSATGSTRDFTAIKKMVLLK